MIATSFPGWLAERLPLVIFVLVFLAQIGRGIWRAYQAKQAPPAAKPDELESQRRAREIQEAIRRKRAERTGSPMPAEPTAPPPSPARPDPTQIPDLLSGPLRRVLQELQREITPPPPTPPPLPVERDDRAGELQRQRQLAEQLHALEQAKAQAQRRAASFATARALAADGESDRRSEARGKLLDDLRDSDSVRRAFVLREVLGTPVGLR